MIKYTKFIKGIIMVQFKPKFVEKPSSTILNSGINKSRLGILYQHGSNACLHQEIMLIYLKACG